MKREQGHNAASSPGSKDERAQDGKCTSAKIARV